MAFKNVISMLILFCLLGSNLIVDVDAKRTVVKKTVPKTVKRTVIKKTTRVVFLCNDYKL